MSQSESEAVNYDRVRSVLALRGKVPADLARDLDVTLHHLIAVLKGERPSQRLLERVRAELGEAGWAFASGETNTLDAGAAA